MIRYVAIWAAVGMGLMVLLGIHLATRGPWWVVALLLIAAYGLIDGAARLQRRWIK